jgi:hypothetical protein
VGSIGAPWLVFLAAATYRWERANAGTLPRPSVYVMPSLVFAGLAVLSESDRVRPVATIAGWALVVTALIGGGLLSGGTAPAAQPTAAQLNQPSFGAGNKTQTGRVAS